MVANNAAFPSTGTSGNAGGAPNAANPTPANPSPTPLANSPATSTPTPPANPAPTPVFSSGAPAFASSATGDILLNHPTKKSKKPLIIAAVAIVLLLAIVAAIIFIAAHNNNGSNLARDFSDFSDYLENGNGAHDDTLYAVSLINANYPQSDSSIALQKEYADTLLTKYTTFQKLAGASTNKNLRETIYEYNKTLTLLINYLTISDITTEAEQFLNSDNQQELENFITEHFFTDDDEPILVLISQRQIAYLDQAIKLSALYASANCNEESIKYECAIKQYGTDSEFATVAADVTRAYYSMTDSSLIDIFKDLLVSQTSSIANLTRSAYE